MPDKPQLDTGADREEETPNFGTPADLKRLLALAKLDERDVDSAVRWFDENAGEDWQGALE